ncbi:MAG: hypothetical protein CBD52_000025 [Euryarchaeota archaeon TMED192]|nr:MAG: hypothetical protein CBD52_000025 [Euryarchaeota archaeon TMED192]
MHRRDSRPLIFEMVGNLIDEAIEAAWSSVKIHDPIHELPDFPALRPTSPTKLTRQAAGLHAADRRGFDLRLDDVIGIMYRPTPGLFDHEERLEAWLHKNAHDIADQISMMMAIDWLKSALDENFPDTDRWYLGYALFAGRTIQGSFAAIEKSNSVLSMVFGSMEKPNHGEQILHPRGVLAVNSILDAMDNTQSMPAVNSWLPALAMYPSVAFRLQIANRALEAIIRYPESNCSGCVDAMIQISTHDSDSARRTLMSTCDLKNRSVSTLLAERLDSLSGRMPNLALEIHDRLTITDDSSLISILSNTLASLCTQRPEEYSVRAAHLISIGNDRSIRRLIESGFRTYLDHDPNDQQGLLSNAWVDGGDLSRSRLKGLISEQRKISIDAFEATLKRINEVSESEAISLREEIMSRETR